MTFIVKSSIRSFFLLVSNKSVGCVLSPICICKYYIRYTFLSNHNIYKSSYDLCFLIANFFKSIDLCKNQWCCDLTKKYIYVLTLECVFRDCMPYLKASLAFFTQKATSFGQEATHKKGDVHRENQEQPLIPSNWSSLVFCMWLDSLWLDFPIKNLLAVNLSKS